MADKKNDIVKNELLSTLIRKYVSSGKFLRFQQYQLVDNEAVIFKPHAPYITIQNSKSSWISRDPPKVGTGGRTRSGNRNSESLIDSGRTNEGVPVGAETSRSDAPRAPSCFPSLLLFLFLFNYRDLHMPTLMIRHRRKRKGIPRTEGFFYWNIYWQKKGEKIANFIEM